MRYMADPVLEAVEETQAKMGPPSRILDSYLAPQFAAAFLRYQLYCLSWPEEESHQTDRGPST